MKKSAILRALFHGFLGLFSGDKHWFGSIPARCTVSRCSTISCWTNEKWRGEGHLALQRTCLQHGMLTAYFFHFPHLRNDTPSLRQKPRSYPWILVPLFCKFNPLVSLLDLPLKWIPNLSSLISHCTTTSSCGTSCTSPHEQPPSWAVSTFAQLSPPGGHSCYVAWAGFFPA